MCPARSAAICVVGVPIALIGGETRYFCVDLDPAEGGEVGQVIHASPEDDERRVVASSTDAPFSRGLPGPLRRGAPSSTRAR